MKSEISVRTDARKQLGKAALGLCSLALLSCGAPSSPPEKPETWEFIRIVNSSQNSIDYAYAPSIILKDGTYHVFFCSVGSPAWDFIRYVTSADGRNWSTPTIVLRATATNGTDMAACDPSVVFYQGFYYMYYSSAYATAPGVYQTVIQVARSGNIAGPYLTYTLRGTWEDTPSDPQVIIYPLVKQRQNPPGYGAGQQSVVAKNEKLLMWYTDDSIDPNAGLRTYMLESTDAVTWTPDRNKEISIQGAHSIDVKFDGARNQFVMTRIIDPHSASAYLARSFSPDGLSWIPFTTLIGVSAFPAFAKNVGAVGEETGNTTPSRTLVAFGAPYGLRANDVWGQWDLYGVFVDPP